MTHDAKLAAIKAQLEADIRAEGVTKGKWIAVGVLLKTRIPEGQFTLADMGSFAGEEQDRANCAFIATSRTKLPAARKAQLDEILWLEEQRVTLKPGPFKDTVSRRLAQIVANWPEEL